MSYAMPLELKYHPEWVPLNAQIAHIPRAKGHAAEVRGVTEIGELEEEAGHVKHDQSAHGWQRAAAKANQTKNDRGTYTHGSKNNFGTSATGKRHRERHDLRVELHEIQSK